MEEAPKVNARPVCSNRIVGKKGAPPTTKPVPQDVTPVPAHCVTTPAASLSPLALRESALRLLPRVGIGTAPKGKTLVNAETIMWADTPSSRALPTATVTGQRVLLRISLTQTRWTFGDTTTATWTTAGKPYDAQTDPCETAQCPNYDGHTYTQPGPVTVELQVAWNAQYSVNSTHWTTVPGGQLLGPTSTAQLTMRQARGVLVPIPASD
jgi:hypothetical protein